MADLSPVAGPTDDRSSSDTPAPVDPSAEALLKLNKEKKKLRGAWISFVSRIVAQFVGSAATIVLGLFVLHQYQSTGQDEARAGEGDRSTAESFAAPVRERGTSEHPSLAVLPFDHFSGDPAQEHLSNAMTEAVITALSQIDGLRVISRTSSMRYRGAGKSVPEIARELAVDWIVEGSVTSSDGRVRVIGQLIDSTTDEHVWAASYERPLADVLSLQSNLALLMAREVGTAISHRGAATRTSSELDQEREAVLSIATDRADVALEQAAQDGESVDVGVRP